VAKIARGFLFSKSTVDFDNKATKEQSRANFVAWLSGCSIHPPTRKISCVVMLLVLPGLNAFARRIVGPVNSIGFS
jgi:hypothetical protein